MDKIIKHSLIALMSFFLICFSLDAATKTSRMVVVAGKVSGEEGASVEGIWITVSESKAGFLVMREKELFRTKIKKDGTFEASPIKHRSSWQLIARIDGTTTGLEHATIGFDQNKLDRSKKFADGLVLVNIRLKRIAHSAH